LLVQEGAGVYDRIQSGEFDIGRYFQQTFNALPGGVTGLLDRFGLTDLGLVQERLSAALRKSSQYLAGQALNLGQNTLNFVLSLFVMLYLPVLSAARRLRTGRDYQGGDFVAPGATAHARQPIHRRHPCHSQRHPRRRGRARRARRSDLLASGDSRAGDRGDVHRGVGHVLGVQVRVQASSP
jgi:hypothetical protein